MLITGITNKYGLAITQWVKIGELLNGIKIDESILPKDFFSKFVSEKYLYTNNTIVENPDYISKEIIRIKEDKISALSEACTNVIYEGIDISISDGITEHFTLDEQDQLNLSGLGLELAAGAEFISWHEDDKTKHCRFYTAADAAKIIQSLTVWKSYHITYFRDLRIYITEALNTKEEVEAVEYGMVLPEEYKSAVLKYYENLIANA